MSLPLILSPAGTGAAVTAAVRCGADAVYLGAKHFNARRNAENFDDLSLPETVAYCHGRGVQVFVTVNTLVMDSEMALLEEEADLIARSGVDSVIVQDPAVMMFFRDRYPSIRRDASTQTAVHNLDGAKYLEDLGYDTVVLARELSLDEMHTICSGISARGEAFVHGAHCMSVSGACYLSAMLGGRSGNRGLCAQPCRLDWKCGTADYALSLKDMSVISRVKEMAEAGVGVLKIEGRMKRPEYVAAVTTACRAALNGEPYDEDTLRAVFSRSGFTSGYLDGKRDVSMFGYRTKEDVTGAEKVFKELQALYKNENPLVPVEMDFSCTRGGSFLTVSDGSLTCTAEGPEPEEARTRPLDEEGAAKNLKKTGGTPFAVSELRCEIGDGLTLPASALNALRRDALDGLLALRSAPISHEKYPPLPAKAVAEPRNRNKEPVLWARFSSVEQIPAGENFEKILLPVARISPELITRFGARLIGELPAVLWPEDERAFEKKLSRLAEQGLRTVYTENIYGIPLAKRLGLEICGGACMNVLNTESLLHYESEGLKSVTASFELSMSKIKELGGSVPLGIVAYGRLPLMRFRNCPVKARKGCSSCGGKGYLTDRMKKRFPVECGDKKYSTLLNSVPLHIAERDLRGLDYALLYFTTEGRDECARVEEDYRLRRKSASERTGGLYYRELL